MPKGELFINGKDAYIEYGLSMQTSGLSSLMTPVPNKEYIQNKSRQEHGKRVIVSDPKLDERDLSLSVHITSKTKEDFLSKYSRFCDVLAKGSIEISTVYQPDIVYRMNYVSCSQFSEFRLGIAKFTLRLNEPNPANRTGG